MSYANLLSRVTDHYLKSNHFNGMPIDSLRSRKLTKAQVADGSQLISLILKRPRQPTKAVINAIRALVESGHLTVVFGDVHPNPHIRALPDEDKNITLTKLSGPNVGSACLYPTSDHLKTVVNLDDYAGRPYALELALGCPQLEHRAFDMHALEPYRNDPRFSYHTNDISGHISVKSDSTGLRDSEEVYIRFGFCYDDDSNRFVAVFVWDLFKISDEAQQLWRMREVNCRTVLHPDYFRSAIMGEFGQLYTLLSRESEIGLRHSIGKSQLQ